MKFLSFFLCLLFGFVMVARLYNLFKEEYKYKNNKKLPVNSPYETSVTLSKPYPAIHNGSVVSRYHFTYTDGNGNVTQRTVQPLKIYSEGERNFKYINAYCELRNDMRTFIFKRISPPVIDVETGEIIELDNLPYTQVYIGRNGGRYVLNSSGKKDIYNHPSLAENHGNGTTWSDDF